MNLAWIASPWALVVALAATGYSLAMIHTHAPTGWQVDPDTGHVFGTQRQWKGKRIGSLALTGYLVSQTAGRDWLLHRVVWEAVRGRIPAGHEINHLNGEKTDNRIVNLECTTKSGNLRHAYGSGLRARTGGSVGKCCDHHHAAKLTADQVREIRGSRESGPKLATRYGISRSQVSRIRRRKGWSCVA